MGLFIGATCRSHFFVSQLAVSTRTEFTRNFVAVSTDVLVQVFPGGLRAVNALESDKLSPLIGREVMAKISQPRNIRFHRKYFALIGTALQMVDADYTMEQFRALCIAGAGYCDFVQGAEGLVAVPRSMSFAAMDETEFDRLYQDTLTFICKRWVLDQYQLSQMVEFF